MADIDNLQIQISANATKAKNALGELVTKLNDLSRATHNVSSVGLMNLSGALKNFSSSAQTLNNIKTADFTRLCKNLAKVGNVDSSAISSTAKSLNKIGNSMRGLQGIGPASTDVATLASSLSKLGGAKVEKAISNIPKLSSALKSMMITLSTTPQVSANLIQMTNALANLASQGSKIGTATSSINANLGKFNNSSKTAKKHALSLASAFGKFYASCFLIIRGVKTLWKSIQSAMNYTEIANYMDRAIDQATSSVVEKLGGAGEESAQAYVSQFSDTMKSLQSKMTGFEVSSEGMKMSNSVNLGLDTTQLTNYQTTFLQMASSMGTTAEQAQKLSTVLTEIGADLASVKNMDFDTVWGDMASGLVGMSRTLDKYGVNIRNVNLQQELSNLGIEASITKLNQNEKALLRTITLLKSTQFAYGDLANTLNETEECFIWCVA